MRREFIPLTAMCHHIREEAETEAEIDAEHEADTDEAEPLHASA